MSITNAISIDVEDYFQVSAFEHAINRNDWDKLEHRISKNMEKTLEVLSNKQVNATFFVLGWVAERYPAIIKNIIANGHELACHGYGHQRVTDLSKSQFLEDISRAKKILEDLSGLPVTGYRAPSYSIGKKNIWALDVLGAAGFEYSSSIYPIKHDHYGYPDAPRFVFRDKNSGLVEIPISTVKVANKLLPAGGGGFFRFYPYSLSRWVIKRVNQVDKQPVIFYFHPWELDPDQPRQHNLPLKSRFRHYLNLSQTEQRLNRLLTDLKWDRMDEVFIKGKEFDVIELS